MDADTKDKLDALSLAVFRKHPLRMLWWYVAEWSVNVALALQDSIESSNRASLEARMPAGR
jgi:hypothetical protein